MKRIAVGILCLLLLAALALSFAGRPATSGYTVAQVQAGLGHHPAVWVGKTVVVRGWISGAGGGMNCRQAVASTCAVNWVRFDPTPGFNPSTPQDAEFDVLLPRGMQPERLYPRGWASVLGLLPGVGPNLTAKTLRVRLTPPPPSCKNASGLCTGGILIP
jgi:hypothetical protein